MREETYCTSKPENVAKLVRNTCEKQVACAIVGELSKIVALTNAANISSGELPRHSLTVYRSSLCSHCFGQLPLLLVKRMWLSLDVGFTPGA